MFRVRPPFTRRLAHTRESEGRPGYLHIETAHEGDQDGKKGITINVLDEVTQWEIVAGRPQISEHWPIPVLERILEQLPFLVYGFIPTTA